MRNQLYATVTVEAHNLEPYGVYSWEIFFFQNPNNCNNRSRCTYDDLSVTEEYMRVKISLFLVFFFFFCSLCP